MQLVSNLIHNLRSDDLVTGCGVIPPALKEAWIQSGHDHYIVESMLSNYIIGDGNFASMSYTYNKPNLVEVFLLGKLIKALDTELLKVTAPEGEFTPHKFFTNAQRAAKGSEIMDETAAEGAGDGNASTKGKSTNDTPIDTGKSKSPNNSMPNSIYEQVNSDDTVKSRTFYDGYSNIPTN